MEMFPGTLDALDKVRIEKPLKFEDLADRGERIRSYDFKGMDYYIEGVVVNKGWIKHPVTGTPMYKGYTIDIDVDTAGEGSRVGDQGYVPFETDFMEYDDRIQVVEA